MFSYLAAEKLYLVATRNISLLVKDADDLAKADNKYLWL
jgi:hypothetical protein